jgi:hypothetical protein
MEANRAHPLDRGARPAGAGGSAPLASAPLALGAILIAGIGLFAVHARAYAAWLVDDAGISLAYATNLARGLGLVSQPGAAPVEGYSDPLWVFLLAVLVRAGTLTLPGTLKLVSLAFVAAAYALLLALIQRLAVRPVLVGAAVLVFSSANPAFVIWCMSGLENALYTFTIVLLAYVSLKWSEHAREGAKGGGEPARIAPAVWSGAIAFLVAITRPDGILFALVPPALVVATRRSTLRTPRTHAAYAIAFGAPMGLFLLARLVVFHQFVPNTYVAKGGLRLADALAFVGFMPAGVHKLEGLLEGAFTGLVTNGVLVAVLVAARIVAKRGSRANLHGSTPSLATRAGGFTPPLLTLVAFAFAALADFMLLPSDRMGEHRFGTPFYPLYYAATFALIDAAIEVSAVRAARKALALGAIAGSLFLASLPDFAGRAFLFARAPNIGLFYVRRAFAERIDRYAETLHIEGGSVLLPDVGAMLLWSQQRVIDGAGLCDAVIARTLTRDPSAARQYVFGEVRPTFIHTHNVWARALALEADTRFERDYVAIHRYDAGEDPEAEGHAAGLFVRRDALDPAGGEAALSALRREHHFRLAFLPPPADTFVLRWLDRTALVDLDYRARLAAILREPESTARSLPPVEPDATR